MTYQKDDHKLIPAPADALGCAATRDDDGALHVRECPACHQVHIFQRPMVTHARCCECPVSGLVLRLVEAVG